MEGPSGEDGIRLIFFFSIFSRKNYLAETNQALVSVIET